VIQPPTSELQRRGRQVNAPPNSAYNLKTLNCSAAIEVTLTSSHDSYTAGGVVDRPAVGQRRLARRSWRKEAMTSDERITSGGISESHASAGRGRSSAHNTSDAADETALLDRLRCGDEPTFLALVDRYSTLMLRLALTYVRNRQVAEEVVQEAWVGVLLGLNRFEGRSTLKTWIYRILINTAKTRAVREDRTLPFSSLPELDLDLDGPSVEPDRFFPQDHQRAGGWTSFLRRWDDIPEERLLAQETRGLLREAIDALPSQQREVILLRDVEGWQADEVCDLLEISEANQRVLLHRARSKIRRVLERYLTEE
jgi:RNA polymerase sigma-70 factor (ECF subfamily)